VCESPRAKQHQEVAGASPEPPMKSIPLVVDRLPTDRAGRIRIHSALELPAELATEIPPSVRGAIRRSTSSSTRDPVARLGT
jgi:hypothetical protein